MNRNRYGYATILSLGVLLILLFIERFSLPDNTFWLRELNNAGHTPLFGMLSLLILTLLRISLGARRMKTTTYYWLALIVSGLIAALSELVQYSGPRDADLIDFLRDLAGAGSFLAVHWSLGSQSGTNGRGAAGRGRLRWLAAGALLFLASLVPLALWGGAYIHRNATFPQVADYDSYWSKKFLSPQEADLDFVPKPAIWADGNDNRVARMQIRPAEYSGLAIVEPYPDWTGYEFLNFAIYSPLPGTLRLEIRINDAAHDNDYSDRFNRTLSVVPGSNRFEISLDDVRTAPRLRDMDMTEIAAIVLFSWKPTKAFTVYVDDVYLR